MVDRLSSHFMKPGMDELRLMDGACICDVLVQASPQSIVAAFGQPVQLAQNGEEVADSTLAAGITLFAASFDGLERSVVEAADASDEPDDYIVTLLRQAGAALAGSVLDLPPSYENGLGVAKQAAKRLGVPAVVVWGSDEWTGVGGGALFSADGEIMRACNLCGPDAIARHLASRERMIAGADDDDDEPAEEDDVVVIYEPGRELRTVSGEVIAVLDDWFKQLGAAQPQSPPSLWGVWQDYAQVWGATTTPATTPR